MIPPKKISLLLLIFILTISGIWWYAHSTREPEIEFTTAPVRRSDIRSAIVATGKIQAVTLTKVGTQISGTLKALYVDYNSVVKKGELIALIDPAVQEADLAQAKAALSALQADVKEMETALKQARQNAVRSKELHELDLISRASLETDETSVATAESRLSSAKARVRQQQGVVRKANLQLGYTKIHSPVSGVVITKNVDVGQTVAASFNTPTLVEIAEDLSRMHVEVYIDEADIGKVHEGQVAEFTVDALPGRKFRGTVAQIRLFPVTENNVTSYTAIVSFVNEQVKGRNLVPGMTANVTLVVDERKDVVTVPNAALRFRPVDSDKKGRSGRDGEKTSVYELQKGKPVKIEVECGITDGVATEVIAGLEPGREIVVGMEAPKD